VEGLKGGEFDRLIFVETGPTHHRSRRISTPQLKDQNHDKIANWTMHGESNATSIVDIVARVSSQNKASIRADKPLMGLGIGLDSLGIVGLFISLEERFPRQMAKIDVASLDFSTIAMLVDCLIRPCNS
jgi:acyl carrier protein